MDVYIYIYIYRVKTQGSPKTERASSNVKDGKFILSCVLQYILPSFNVILHNISHHVVRTKMDVVHATCTCFCTFLWVKVICLMFLPVELRRHLFSASRTILKIWYFHPRRARVFTLSSKEAFWTSLMVSRLHWLSLATFSMLLRHSGHRDFCAHKKQRGCFYVLRSLSRLLIDLIVSVAFFQLTSNFLQRCRLPW